MFGDYLKQVRNSLNLTQNELAVRLNLADEEFRSLDVVTLSRWERGKTKPALAKCFRILRCLQTDLSEFYNLIPNPNETKLIDEFFKLRFERQFVRISSANYENKPKSQAELIIEHPLLLQDNDEVISNLRNFYETAKYIPNGLFDINLYDYQINRRAILKRFTTQDGVLIGH
ncbi:hypothetical protein VCHA36P166_10073 [Vibrio chagasii]|nr:hypothetical protein VCHA36P166_10073 [Vibrio chagasii]